MLPLLIAVAALAALAAAVLIAAGRRWDGATAALRDRLLAGAAAQPGRFDAASVDALPAPVARYLRAVLRDGQPIPRRVRIDWDGEFNMGRPGSDRWVPFNARQDFVPAAPGFVWDARMRMGGITVRVRDGFVDGEGSMLGRLLALVTVVDRRGGEAMAVAALQRCLGEAIWLPAALLPSAGVQWQAIDERHAQATLVAGTTQATLELRFGADGLVESVYAESRTYDDGRNPPSQHPWQARVLRYGQVGGATVPVEAVVEWLLPTGAYAYWRGRPLRIVVDDAASG
ncbi:MAG: hypothetical protein MUF32_01795 [Burkholderiaceae bacterium]|jgi:hypothetical protein|nr:hypothetical protein [Burkholderiaceae bacterium]